MEFQIILTYILSVLLVYWIGRLILFYTFWQRQGVRCYPFIALGWIRRPFADWLAINARAYGRVFGLYDFQSHILVVNDARLATDISTKELPKFAIRNSKYFGESSVTRSLFFIPANDDWKRIRSIVTPAFTSRKLREMCQPIENILNNFIHHLEKEADTGKAFNIKRYCDSLAMDVIARCGYGIDIDSLSNQDHPVVANARKILGVDVTLSMILCFWMPWLARLLKLEAFNWRSVDYFDKLTDSIVKKRIEADNISSSKDLIGLMIQSARDLGNNVDDQARKNDSTNLKGITMSEITAQSMLFFVAGYDTTNTTFAHIFYYLTKHPEWQEKLYEEIQANQNQLDYEHLKTLPVLNGIINETLRLNPPLTFFARSAVNDTTVCDTGIHVPKGTIISIQPYIIHRDPEYFPDPETFSPERFIEGDAASSPAYMPFGVGPRLCVGMRFALNELRIVLANFIKHYRLEENKNIKLKYFIGNILQSPKEVMVKISKRK